MNQAKLIPIIKNTFNFLLRLASLCFLFIASSSSWPVKKILYRIHKKNIQESFILKIFVIFLSLHKHFTDNLWLLITHWNKRLMPMPSYLILSSDQSKKGKFLLSNTLQNHNHKLFSRTLYMLSNILTFFKTNNKFLIFTELM